MNALTRIAHLDVLLVISALALFPIPSSVGADDVAVTFGKPVKLGEGFGPIEGPAWDRKGALYFSSLSDGKIYRWSKEKGAVLFKQLEGGCNGLRFDAAGNLLVCQPRGRRVLRITPTGKHEVVVDRYKGGRLNSPNDIWIAPDGGVYFTDPRYGKGGELEQDGLYVFYLAPDGKTLVPMIKDLEKPNGIVGTADGKKLFGCLLPTRKLRKCITTPSVKTVPSPIARSSPIEDAMAWLWMSMGISTSPARSSRRTRPREKCSRGLSRLRASPTSPSAEKMDVRCFAHHGQEYLQFR